MARIMALIELFTIRRCSRRHAIFSPLAATANWLHRAVGDTGRNCITYSMTSPSNLSKLEVIVVRYWILLTLIHKATYNRFPMEA